MIDCKQLREIVIKGSLNQIDKYSVAAEELLIATCAQESRGGTYLVQVDGSAFGIFQMQEETYHDIWDRYLSKEIGLRQLIMRSNYLVDIPNAREMATNLKFAAQMARTFYLRCSEDLPLPSNLNAIWLYYKQHWNTYKGAATREQFIKNYQDYIHT